VERSELEITRLERDLVTEQEASKRREQQYMQCHQRRMQDHEQEMKHLSELIAVQTHEKVLEDQANHYRKAMRELEDNLKRQMESHAKTARERRERGVRDVQAAEETALKRCGDLKGSRSDVARRADALELEFKTVGHSKRSTEVDLARIDEQRRTLTGSLSEAGANLSRLQRIVEEEVASSERAEEEAECAKAEAAEAATELSLQTDKLSGQRCAASELENELQQVAKMEELKERRREEVHSHSLELSSMQGEFPACEARLESTLTRASNLQEQCSRSMAGRRRGHAAMFRAKHVLSGHVRDERTAIMQLRSDVQSEMQQIMDSCQDEVTDYVRALHAQNRSTSSDELGIERECQDLERQVRAATDEVGGLEEQLEKLLRDSSGHEEGRVQAETACRGLSHGMERLLMVLPAELPGVPGLEAARLRLLENDALSSKRFAEMLEQLRSDLDAAISRLRSEATTGELQRLEGEVESEVRKEAIVHASQQEASNAEFNAVESQRTILIAKLQEHRGEGTPCQNQRADHISERESSTAQLVARIQAAREEARERDREAKRLQSRMQGIAIEASVDMEVSRKEVAEPLREKLHELFREIDALQQKFAKEWADRERFLSTQDTEDVENHRGALQAIQRRFHIEMESLGQKLNDVREGDKQASDEDEFRVAELTEQLAHGEAELNDLRDSERRSEIQFETHARDEERGRVELAGLESTLAEAQHARDHDLEEFRRRRSLLHKTHDEETTQLRRLKDADLSRMRSLLQDSLFSSSFSEVPLLELETLDGESGLFGGPLEPGHDLGLQQQVERARRQLS